jgi:Fe-S-cluster containining protein
MLLPISSDPRVQQVDSEIFTLRYFAECMKCDFCHDVCCEHGCDVNLGERARILAEKESLSKLVNFPVEQWFTNDIKDDPEYPTGQFVRTQVHNERCVFLNRDGRGCLLHKWALENRRDYHDIKPMVCWLFPVIWDKGILRPNYDVKHGLICADRGPTLFESARSEIQYVFGATFVADLDAMRAQADRLS